MESILFSGFSVLGLKGRFVGMKKTNKQTKQKVLSEGGGPAGSAISQISRESHQ